MFFRNSIAILKCRKNEMPSFCLLGEARKAQIGQDTINKIDIFNFNLFLANILVNCKQIP